MCGRMNHHILSLMLIVSFHSISGDKLIIEKVTCKKVSSGIDNWSKAGAGALGAIVSGGAAAIAGGAVVIGTAGVAIGTIPVTAGAVASAAASGAGGAKSALEFLDGKFSGTDDLIINVNGAKVYPPGEKSYKISAGQTIYPNVEVSFNRACRIQFIEYDTGSDNDDLGSILVNSDAWDKISPGKGYKVVDAIVFSEEEGDIYYITYRVERDNIKQKANWILCGTKTCKKCSEEMCKSTSNKELDRDGDKEDLKKCPYPMIDKGFKEYPQFWPFDDVYLRICSDP